MKIKEELVGGVRVRVKGLQPARFLSVLLARGIMYENAVFEEGSLYLDISARQFREAVSCAKKTGVRLRIVSKRGLPFLFFRHRRRKWTLAFVLPMVITIFILPRFVWTIELEGLVEISQVEMLRRLEQMEVIKGARKSELKLEQVKNQLLLTYEDLSFVSFTLEGTTLRVLIEEKLTPPERVESSEPCDLRAKETCIIYSIVTESGTPTVRAGDVVQAGDIVIRGEVVLKDDAGNEMIIPSHASGEVYGRIRWRGEAEIKKQYEEKIFSEKVRNGLGICFGNNKIVLRWPFGRSEREVVIEEEIWSLPLAGFLSCRRLSYEGYELNKAEYSIEEMEAGLREKLEKQLGEMMSQENRVILEQKWMFEETPEGMRGVLEVEMMEDIGEKVVQSIEETEE